MRKILLSLCALLVTGGVAAQTEFTVDETKYTVTGENTVEITKGKSSNGALVVPSTVTYENTEYTVTSIGEEAYKYSGATSVEIPASIKKIGHGAFMSASSLTSITFHDGLEEIGTYAFSGSKCTALDIPGTVTRIGGSAFFGNTSNPTIQTLTLHEGLKVIENAAFYGNAIKELEIPASVDSIIGTAFLYSTQLEKLTFKEGIKYIGRGAFNNDATVLKARNTTLKSVEFPASLTCIDDEAFFKMPLTSLTIPAGLETLGDLAFSGTDIKTITVDAANKNFKVADDGLLYSKNGKVLYFAPVTGITTVNVPAGCIGISGGAFWNSSLTSITLPKGLLAIGYGAFFNTSLTSIDFPSSLTYIDDQAFAQTKLTELVLPENLPYIYDATFYGCNNLKTVTLPSGLQGIDKRAFYGCNNLTTVTCKASTPCYLVDTYEYEDIFTASPKLIVPKGCSAAYRNVTDYYYKATVGKYANNWPLYYSKIEEADKGVLKVVETFPKDGDAFSKYESLAFTVTFDEPITIINRNPEIFLRPNDLVYASDVNPDGGWSASVETGSTLRVWGEDADQWTDYFCPNKEQAKQIYFIVIPAGVVKNEAGDENEEIVIWNYGSEELKQAVEEYLGVEDVTAKQTVGKVTACYGVNGQKLNVPQKGVNIVKYSDGTVNKVLVK